MPNLDAAEVETKEERDERRRKILRDSYAANREQRNAQKAQAVRTRDESVIAAIPSLPSVVPVSQLERPRVLAERFGVMPRTVRKAMHDGRLPCVVIGGYHYYTTEEAFLAWLGHGEHRPGPVPTIRSPRDPEAIEKLPAFLRPAEEEGDGEGDDSGA